MIDTLGKTISTDAAYNNGVQAFRDGKSIHYNPYQNLGDDYNDAESAWLEGYSSASNQ